MFGVQSLTVERSPISTTGDIRNGCTVISAVFSLTSYVAGEGRTLGVLPERKECV